jgi:hypothetical protein
MDVNDPRHPRWGGKRESPKAEANEGEKHYYEGRGKGMQHLPCLKCGKGIEHESHKSVPGAFVR